MFDTAELRTPKFPHFRTHQSLLGEGKGQLHGAGSVISAEDVLGRSL